MNRPDRQSDERLAAYVDGVMSERERDRFVAELRVNKQLVQDLADYEATVAAVRQALRAETAPVDLADAVMARIGARTSGPVGVVGSNRGYRLVLSAAAAAALLVLAVWLNSLPPTTVLPTTDSMAQNEPAQNRPAQTGPAENEQAKSGQVSEPAALNVTVAAEQDDEAAKAADGTAPLFKAAAERPSKPAESGAVDEQVVLQRYRKDAAGRAAMERDARARSQFEAGVREQKAFEQFVEPPTAGAVAPPEAGVAKPVPAEGVTGVVQDRQSGSVEEKSVVPLAPTESLRIGEGQSRLRAMVDLPTRDKKAEEPPAEVGVLTVLAQDPKSEPSVDPKPGAKQLPSTGSDDFYLGAARRAVVPTPKMVTVTLPYLQLVRQLDAESSTAAAEKARARGPADEVRARAGSRGAKRSATGGPVGPAGTGPSTPGPTSPGAAAPGAAAGARSVDLAVFVAEQFEAAAKPDRFRDETPAPPSVLGLGALRFEEVTARLVPTSPKDARAKAAIGNDAAVNDRCWLVEGPRAGVRAMMQRLASIARTSGYLLGNGEVDLLEAKAETKAETKTETAKPDADKARQNDDPAPADRMRIVLRFRTVR